MRAFILAVAALACAAPALAQTTDPRAICENKDGTGDPADAVYACTQLFMMVSDLTNPGRSLIHVARARAYARLQDLDNARKGLDEAVRLDPTSANAFLERGKFYHFTDNQPDRTLADMNEAIRLDPRLASAWRIRGYNKQNRRDYTGAVGDLTKLIELEPADPANFRDRATVYARMRQYRLALNDFDEALNLSPPASLTRGYLLNGACFMRAALNVELDRARKECDEANAMVVGRLPDFRDSSALVAFRQGRFQDAWNDWDAAVQVRPDFAGAIYGRGIAARRLGRQAEGDADIKKAQALEPGVAGEYALHSVM